MHRFRSHSSGCCGPAPLSLTPVQQDDGLLKRLLPPSINTLVVSYAWGAILFVVCAGCSWLYFKRSVSQAPVSGSRTHPRPWGPPPMGSHTSISMPAGRSRPSMSISFGSVVLAQALLSWAFAPASPPWQRFCPRRRAVSALSDADSRPFLLLHCMCRLQ